MNKNRWWWPVFLKHYQRNCMVLKSRCLDLKGCSFLVFRNFWKKSLSFNLIVVMGPKATTSRDSLWCCGSLHTASIAVGVANLITVLMVTSHYVENELTNKKFNIEVFYMFISINIKNHNILSCLFYTMKIEFMIFVKWIFWALILKHYSYYYHHQDCCHFVNRSVPVGLFRPHAVWSGTKNELAPVAMDGTSFSSRDRVDNLLFYQVPWPPRPKSDSNSWYSHSSLFLHARLWPLCGTKKN